MQADASFARVSALMDRRGGGETIVAIREDLHRIMEDAAGIYRDEVRLQEACGALATLRARFATLGVGDTSREFNTQLYQALELGAMLAIGEAMAHAALARRESRGAHQRLDHPARDDGAYLHHSLAWYDGDGPPRLGTRPVAITRWAPGERVYGGAAA